MIHIHNILVPTDFSESSHFATEMACAVARGEGAHVILLHVSPQPPAIVRDVPAFKEQHVQEDFAAYRQEIDARMARLRKEIPARNVESLVAEGETACSILRIAEEKACDVIIMGTHGKSRMLQLMMGSVAAEVSRKACCPVITVRVPPAITSTSAPASTAMCAVGQ